jgi:hypothetical protein
LPSSREMPGPLRRYGNWPEFELRQSINRLVVNVLGVNRGTARRFPLAAWELIMDFVKPQESLEPPVDTGVDTGAEGQSTAIDEAVPSLEADEAVTLEHFPIRLTIS